MEASAEHTPQPKRKMSWEDGTNSEIQREIEVARDFGHQFDIKTAQAELIARASQIQGEAHSYWGFHVGVAVLAFNAEGEYEFFEGHNYKERPGADPEKQCAEEMALQEAWKKGFHYIRAMAIVGEAKRDDSSGMEHDTLHPCATCRGHLGTLLELGAMDDQTRVITTDPLQKYRDSMDPEEVIASHLNKAT